MYICNLYKKEKSFNLYSLGLLFLLFFFSPLFLNKVSAATLSINPSSGSYDVGDTVVLRVNASSDTPFNAVSSVINIPTNSFSIESVSKAGSALNFWVTEPSFSRSTGTVKLEGVTLGGYNGRTGNIITITLRALKVGSASIAFQSGQILANDGEGTDITGSLLGANFTINEAKPKPEPVKQETIPKEIVPEPEIEKPVSIIKAPEIVYGIRYNQPYIIGISNYSKAEILLTFISQTGSKIFITGTSEVDGGFSLPVPHSLKRGEYTVTAIMVKEDGSHSGESNKIIINIGNIFSDIGWEIWLILIILVLIIIYLISRVLSYTKDDKNHKGQNHSSKKEIRKVEDVLHKSFDILREDMDEDGTSLKKDINSAEKAIGKEIRDIEYL